ncbi:hypothetical protein HFRIS_002349 [Herbaspirillum frisingense GSF30]|uniref:Uncharacterized protein n=1 Tax=Herbaspirillum frisingense GSF30 TaxID=864073 RepID=A0AAI9N5F5_9BURK|nr:hypothetical protein [Herbaspirillum frisingense]EOA06563.1 hypothetical protein HFRIS_002349 [Herbaspirillum frisingense GSF30]
MEIDPIKQLSSDDMALLLKAMEKLKDDLHELSQALDQVAFEMEEEEAQKFEQVVLDTISKIKRQIQQFH